MEKVVLMVHLIVAVAMVIVVLLQRSEGAGLVGPSASSMSPIRGSANGLTRMTAILATIFFITSLTLAIMANQHRQPVSIADQIASEQQEVPVSGEAPVTPPTADVPPVTPPVSSAPSAPTPPVNP